MEVLLTRRLLIRVVDANWALAFIFGWGLIILRQIEFGNAHALSEFTFLNILIQRIFLNDLINGFCNFLFFLLNRFPCCQLEYLFWSDF